VNERDHLEDVDVDGRIILKWSVRMRSGFTLLRIGTSGELVWTRQWTFGFHKRRISWPLVVLLVFKVSAPRA